MKIEECRICGNRTLLSILDLGPQALTSVFPESPETPVPKVPLELVKCSPSGCGLVQLAHTADFGSMYGDHYGYRSGIRPFMINHLGGKVATLLETVKLDPGNLVLDIGSNDGTLLAAYPKKDLELVGVDPSGAKFADLYPEGSTLLPDFFTERAFTDRFGDRKAKVVTSISMFYDLPRPLDFMRDVYNVLDDDGVWMMEQSYMPAMLDATGYDIVCHEHLEFYALRQIEWMAERVGFTVIAAEINSVYGGSLCAILAKRPERHRVDNDAIDRIRASEERLGLDTMAPYEAFAKRVPEFRDELLRFLEESRRAGKTTLGYGASTKGNVILQYCGLTQDDLPCIGEVSTEKAGRITPGSHIPIVSEAEAKSRNPDQLLVLPWIYRDGFVEREHEFLAGGGRLVFPHPRLEVV